MCRIACSVSRLLDLSKKQKNQYDHENEPDSSTRPVTPTSAIRPAWDCTNKKKNQNYYQD